MTKHPGRPAASTDTPADAEQGFLQRWSSRKLEDGKADRGESHERPMAGQAATSVDAAEADYLPTDDDMPPIESLHADSDVSGFLSPKVSDELRRLALRKLFHSAKFNVTDGLDDYAEDFRNFAGLGGIITADMRYEMERALEQAGKLASDEHVEGTEKAPGAQPDEASADPATSGSPEPEAPERVTDAGDGETVPPLKTTDSV